MFQLTPAVKNLLIINILVFGASVVFRSSLGVDLNDTFGLHYYLSDDFGAWQFITFMFMHGDLSHVFFNMFAVFMFGRTIEDYWGTKRFLIYYFATGIGSGIIQEVALFFDISPFIRAVDAYLSNPSTEALNDFFAANGPFSTESIMAYRAFASEYNALLATDMSQAQALARGFMEEYQAMFIDAHVTIGASGAVFGILLAFGMLFPNQIIMLMIPPIPLKAKWFVLIYGLIELWGGIANSSADNVAHWAHLGGMLFGYFLIKKWKNNGEF